MSTPNSAVPFEVTQKVETFIDDAVAGVATWSNVELLDESQAWSLHRTAAEIYQLGYEHGLGAQTERGRRAHVRRQSRVDAVADDAKETP